VDANGISTGTISVSDGTNTYTVLDGPTNAAGYRSKTFYAANIAATTVTITATVQTSNTQRSIMVQEWTNVSTSTPIDQHSAITAETSGTGGLITGPSVTTTADNEGLASFFLCNGTCDQNNASFLGYAVQPSSQSIGDTKGNIATFRVVGAHTSFADKAIDSAGASQSDAAVTISLKQ